MKFRSQGNARIVLPRIQPMRLTRVAKPFDDPDYVFELKHDGFRALAYIEAGECKLVSRNSNQFKSFVSLKESLGKIPIKNAILDGEVVCLDSNGVSKFNELMSRKGKPVFYVFDLLWLDGKDLRSLPLIERKQRLYELIQRSRCRRHFPLADESCQYRSKPHDSLGS